MKKLRQLIRLLFDFGQHCADDRISIYAAQASFFLTLSIIPFVMIIISLIQFIVPVDMNGFLRYIHDFIPKQFWGFAASIAAELFEKSTSIKVISFTAVAALWSASRAFMALEGGLDNVFSGTVTRNYFIRRILAFIYTAVFVAVIVATFILMVFGRRIQLMLEVKFSFISVLLSSVVDFRHLIVLIVLTLYFSLMYRALPQHTKKPRHIVSGAFFAALGWIVFSMLYAFYINHFADFSRLYGSLAAIAFLMLWEYFCMNILFIGAELSQRLSEGFFESLLGIFKKQK